MHKGWSNADKRVFITQNHWCSVMNYITEDPQILFVDTWSLCLHSARTSQPKVEKSPSEALEQSVCRALIEMKRSLLKWTRHIVTWRSHICIRRILRIRRRDCVPSVELRRRLHLTSIPALLLQRRLRWFRHAVRRPEGELIKDLLLPNTASHVAQASWRPAEDMGNHDKSRSETALRTASLRPRTLEEGLGENVYYIIIILYIIIKSSHRTSDT